MINTVSIAVSEASIARCGKSFARKEIWWRCQKWWDTTWVELLKDRRIRGQSDFTVLSLAQFCVAFRTTIQCHNAGERRSVAISLGVAAERGGRLGSMSNLAVEVQVVSPVGGGPYIRARNRPGFGLYYTKRRGNYDNKGWCQNSLQGENSAVAVSQIINHKSQKWCRNCV